MQNFSQQQVLQDPGFIGLFQDVLAHKWSEKGMLVVYFKDLYLGDPSFGLDYLLGTYITDLLRSPSLSLTAYIVGWARCFLPSLIRKPLAFLRTVHAPFNAHGSLFHLENISCRVVLPLIEHFSIPSNFLLVFSVSIFTNY